MKKLKTNPDDQVIRTVHIPRSSRCFPESLTFSPAERMVFHRWRNRYVPIGEHAELFNRPWCPLFGVLPFNHPVAENLIRELREYCGIEASISGGSPEALPDAAAISELSGVPLAKIEAARRFFNDFNAEVTNAPRLNVETRALITLSHVWNLLKIYCRSQKWEKDIFEAEFKKMAETIAKNSKEYAREHAECEKEPLLSALREDEKREMGRKMRISASNRARTAPRKEKNTKQVKDFYEKLFKGQSIEYRSLAAVAKMIEAEIPRPKLSLTTIKNHLQTLATTGKIKKRWREKP